MAKQLEKLTKAFAPHRRSAESACEELRSLGVNRTHMNQMLAEAAMELTRRVQSLRDGGAQGTTLDDFRGDGEVRSILADVEDFKRRQTVAFARWTELRTAAGEAADAIEELRTKVVKEVADRKKKRDRAVLPVGSASLPELEKLAGTMEDVVRAARMELGASSGWKNDVARFDRAMEEAVAATKGTDRVAQDRKAMERHALGLRVLKANVQTATQAHGEVRGACADARRAIESRDGGAVRNALLAGRRAMDTLSALASQYGRAMSEKSDFDLAAMDQTKDGRTVRAAVARISQLAGEAENELAAVTRSAATSLRS